MDLNFNTCGGLRSLRYDDAEFAAPEQTSQLFRIQFRDFIGNPLLVSASDFQCAASAENGGKWKLSYNSAKDCSAAVVVTAEMRGTEIAWGIEVTPGSDELRVEWIDFPCIRIKNISGAKYLLPVDEGVLLDDLANRERKASFHCDTIGYPMSGVSSFYPGPAPMQFEAVYADGCGLCFICRDAAHAPKALDMKTDGEDAARIHIQHFTGGENTLAYEVAVIGFDGDWQDAADIYRRWMESCDTALPAKTNDRPPTFLADSPVLLIYPVKGSGLDTGSIHPNEFYPYRNALPIVERYRGRLNNPMLAVLMHWEGTAPWAPPYVWPPYGGEDELADFVAEMHRNGDRVGLYSSGIGWTQKSMIDPRYDCRERYAAEHVEKEICRGPRGEAFSRVCNGLRGQRLGYDLCPARDFTAKTVTREIAAAARIGIDYLQYFDQNQGCAAPLCYSHDHGHPDLPGPWLTKAMQDLLDRAEESAQDTLLGCENAAAEPYTKVCRLNDLRNHLAWGVGGIPVPLYQYLFHEYTAGFTGNGVCLSSWVDFSRTPFFTQWSLAWNFAAGNLLSVVLKDGGKIHWHWALPWDVAPPEQEPLLELIANLSEWRRGEAGEFLIAGRMEKSPETICGARTIISKVIGETEVPAVITAAWSHGGKRAVLLVNYNKTRESCRVNFTAEESGSCRERNGTVKPFAGTSATVEVPPLDAVLLEFSGN